MSDDFDFEPIPGLPENLPVGEHIVWQGRPKWTALARHAYHSQKIAAYFAGLVTLRLMLAVHDGQPMMQAMASFGMLLVAGLAAVVLITGLAYLSARSTVYTITNKRIVMRFGIALPLTLNLPLSQVTRADLALRSDGVGDISLSMTPGKRLAFLVLWPHARAWHITNPRPSLRCLDDASTVARLLSEVLEKAALDAREAVIRFSVVRGNAATQSAEHTVDLQAAE